MGHVLRLTFGQKSGAHHAARFGVRADRAVQGQARFGVVAEAMGGLRHLTDEPGRLSVRVGVSIGDRLASLHGVIGVLLALNHRNNTKRAATPKGVGQVIDVALYESVFNVMESLLP